LLANLEALATSTNGEKVPGFEEAAQFISAEDLQAALAQSLAHFAPSTAGVSFGMPKMRLTESKVH